MDGRRLDSCGEGGHKEKSRLTMQAVCKTSLGKIQKGENTCPIILQKFNLDVDQAPEDDGRRSTTQGGGGGDTRDTEVPMTVEPPRDRHGPGRRPMAARGGKRTRDTVAESSTRRGAQIRAADAGGWRVWENSRWTTYHSGVGDGEKVYRE